MPDKDLYAVLQVSPVAELIVIQAAYRALARSFHPDGGTPDSVRMAELNDAFQTLRDPRARAAYDAERRRMQTHAVPIVQEPAQPVPQAHGWGRKTQAESPVLDFGRYEGWTINQIARQDPDYLRWLSRHSSGIRFRSAITAALAGDGTNRSRTSVG